MKNNTIPRRNDLALMGPAERAIYTAQLEVEKLGAHVMLTEATELLIQVRRLVSEYIEEQDRDWLDTL